MSFCGHCGAPLPEDAVFCGNCGAQVSNPSISEPLENFSENAVKSENENLYNNYSYSESQKNSQEFSNKTNADYRENFNAINTKETYNTPDSGKSANYKKLLICLAFPVVLGASFLGTKLGHEYFNNSNSVQNNEEVKNISSDKENESENIAVSQNVPAEDKTQNVQKDFNDEKASSNSAQQISQKENYADNYNTNNNYNGKYEYEDYDCETYQPDEKTLINNEYYSFIYKPNTYVFDNSDKRYLSYSDIEYLNADVLAYARNEIFARHGYIFKGAPFKKYFADKIWYNENPYFKGDDNELNEYEKANCNLILKQEKILNSPYLP